MSKCHIVGNHMPWLIWNIFSKEIIVDMLSVERNNILVRTYLIGGPSERILPKRQIKLVSFSQPSLVDPSLSQPGPEVIKPEYSLKLK